MIRKMAVLTISDDQNQFTSSGIISLFWTHLGPVAEMEMAGSPDYKTMILVKFGVRLEFIQIISYQSYQSYHIKLHHIMYLYIIYHSHIAIISHSYPIWRFPDMGVQKSPWLSILKWSNLGCGYPDFGKPPNIPNKPPLCPSVPACCQIPEATLKNRFTLSPASCGECMHPQGVIKRGWKFHEIPPFR